MISKENFSRWACDFRSGSDGGSENAKNWIVGIEFGLSLYKRDKEGLYSKEYVNEINELKFPEYSKEYNFKDHLEYTYGRSFAKLYTAIKLGKSIDLKNEYKKKVEENICWNQEVLKLNLYPLAFKNTDHAIWNTEYKLSNLFPFNTKKEYLLWSQFHRFQMFREKVLKDKPELIICTGISHVDSFLSAFIPQSSHKLKISELSLIECKENKERTFFQISFFIEDHQIQMYVIPFFSGARGLNSFRLIEELAKHIRKSM